MSKDIAISDAVREALQKTVPHLAHLELCVQIETPRASVVSVNDEVAVKFGSHVQRGEAEAVDFVASNTAVPVPIVRGVVEASDGLTYIVMDKVHGTLLGNIWDSLAMTEKEHLAKELGSYMATMHAVKGTYVGALGRRPPCHSMFEGTANKGPYNSEQELNAAIVRAERRLWKRRGGSGNPPEAFVESTLPWLPHNHIFVFSHGQLEKYDIVVKKNGNQTTVAGILSWGKAGFYPEYWDFVNALVATDWSDNWIQYIPKIFTPYYREYALWSSLRRLAHRT